MSADRNIRSTCRTTTIPGLVVALVLVLAAPTSPAAGGEGHLWLYPDSVDPRAGGHVVESGTFTLHVANRGAGTAANISEAFLVVAVDDPAKLAGAILTLPDGTVATVDSAALEIGTPILPCSGRPMPPHGEYPAAFTTVALGDLAAGSDIAIGVEITGEAGLRVHLDACGHVHMQAGQRDKCQDVTSPYGHDVTVLLGGAGTACHELEVEKVASSTGVDLGAVLEYRIAVTNSGSCELTDVAVTDAIPTAVAGGGGVPAFSVLAVAPPATSTSVTEIVWILGTLAPGATATFTVSARFDVAETDGHRVANTACATAAELERGRCARAVVTVGEAPSGIGGAGYWCNQVRFARDGRRNARLTVEELVAWLHEIGIQSAVFHELHDASAPELAQTLLCSPSLAEETADRLARQLLALWLNLSSGRVDGALTLGALCPGAEPPPPGMDGAATVASVVAAAEAALVAGDDDGTLGTWLALVDYVNNARRPGDAGCNQVRRKVGGRR